MAENPFTIIKVLIFEDDAEVTQLVRAVLDQSKTSGLSNFQVLSSNSLSEALKKITSDPPDVVLASLTNKTDNILQTISEINRCNRDIPIITIGAQGYENLSLEAIKLGAQDCLFKESLDPARILTTIQYAIERRRISTGTFNLHMQQLMSIVDSISDGIIVASAEKKVLFANKAAEQILLTSATIMKGNIVPVPFEPGRKIDHTISRPDGSKTFIETTTSIVRWEAAEAGYCVTVHDITDHKRLQADLKKATDLKDEFIAHMSHELRTPMNGILGMTSILSEQQLPNSIRESIETIRASGENMLGMINDLLDLSKIEAGRVELELCDFRVRSLVEETLEIFSDRVEKKGILLSNILKPDVPRFLCGDPSRIRQILANLVSNAVKFTDAGSVIVRVELENTSTQDRPVLRFRVIDSGSGVPKKKHSQLFQPFSQLASDPKRKEGGTGLGLVISKKLTAIMGGQIGFTSVANEGSEFWFTIPLSPPKQHLNQGVRGSLQGKCVLLLSKNAEIRKTIVEQLKLKDCTVVARTDFDEEKIQDAFDLVIIEEHNHKEGWKTLSKRIREHLGETMPILLLASKTTALFDKQLLDAKIATISAFPLRQSVLYAFVADLTLAPWQEDFSTKERDRKAKISQEFDRPKAITKRILVAEDNTINQRVVLSMLERLGVDADLVANGAEAVNAAKRYNYDAILMDCRMPLMDGFEASRKIRKLSSHYKDIPIIAVTANAMKQDIKKCHEASMTDHLCKPIELSQLRMALTKHLKLGINSGDVASDQTHEQTLTVEGINYSVLDSLRSVSTKLGNNLLEEVLQLFEAHTPRLISELKAAIELKDAKGIESTAHKIKGSARNIGAVRLADKCSAIEYCGETNSLTQCGELVTELEAEFSRVLAFLATHKTTTGVLKCDVR